MLRLIHSVSLALLLVLPSLPAFGDTVQTEQAAENSRATESGAVKNAVGSQTQGTATGYNVLQSTLLWRVVSSGGTNATIGSDKILLGTVIQTAIGEVTSPNYIVHQGFWQNFGPYCEDGDVDGSGYVSVSDAVYIINYIFGGGEAPKQGCSSDVNDDGETSMADAVEIINSIFLH